MIGRVIEVASAGRHLARDRGLMTVSHEGVEDGRVPLDDIGVLLCNARDLTYSNELLIELARRGAAVVLCDNYLPVTWLWPLEGNHIQALRMRRQLEASLPLRKRLWQALVKAKIAQQENTLELLGVSGGNLGELAKRVRSGDPENVEAQAARRYWPLLFGDSFRRERFGPMPNPLLNYGYTVLRAATARAVVAAGLHPSVGLHHANRMNAALSARAVSRCSSSSARSSRIAPAPRHGVAHAVTKLTRGSVRGRRQRGIRGVPRPLDACGRARRPGGAEFSPRQLPLE